MATKRPKNITLDFLNKDAKKYDKLKKITFEDNTYIEIYQNLSNKKIDEILNEVGSFLDKYQKNDKLNSLEVTDMINYVNLHLVIYATAIGDDQNYTYEEKVQIFENVTKSDYFEKILQSLLPEDIDKVYKRMTDKLKTFSKQIKSNPEIIKDIQELELNEKLSDDVEDSSDEAISSDEE